MECPWPLEDVSDDCILYRQVHSSQRVDKKRKFPKPSHFAFRANEDYLSFNWERHIDVQKNYDVIGITSNGNGGYLDIKQFTIFSFRVSELRKMSDVKAVKHIPVWDESNQPSLTGRPNNKSHAGLYCNENNLAFRDEMSEFCEDMKNLISFDRDKYLTEISKLIARGNDTPYHKEWEF